MFFCFYGLNCFCDLCVQFVLWEYDDDDDNFDDDDLEVRGYVDFFQFDDVFLEFLFDFKVFGDKYMILVEIRRVVVFILVLKFVENG